MVEHRSVEQSEILPAKIRHIKFIVLADIPRGSGLLQLGCLCAWPETLWVGLQMNNSKELLQDSSFFIKLIQNLPQYGLKSH